MQNRTNVVRRVAMSSVVVGILLIPAMGRGQSHQVMTDQDIKNRVEHEISEISVSGMNVGVQVRNRVVTLTGTVPSLWAKREVVGETREIDDVDLVVDELRVAGRENDRTIAEEVARSVRHYVFYSIYDDVNVSVDNGIVTLTGRTTSPHRAHELAEVASRVPGVRDVRNEIKALPVSIHDDQLRYSVASQIYRDPLFWNYAIEVDPPIHVVVENGRVTLTGGVNSEVDRRKAENIARSTFGVFSVENNLRVE